MKTILVLVLAYCVVILFGAHQTVTALNIYKKTGVLDVTASETGAVISITQQNSQAAIIGTSTAHIRIVPGTYLLSATNAGLQTNSVATVHLKSTSHAALNLNKSNKLRYSADINFENTGVLINDGITIGQLEELEQYFFQFKPLANTVNIVQTTVEPGPHDPNSDNPFTVTFRVFIDSTPYQATISYSDLSNISMDLYGSTNDALLYSSQSATAVSGD